jgi:hypothetical protein
MPVSGDEYFYRSSKEINDDRQARIARWKAKGCSDNKIQELIYRRINSKRQKW